MLKIFTSTEWVKKKLIRLKLLTFFSQGEGVAYRGRALIQLKTTLGELPEVPIDDIPNDDLLKIQVSYYD